MTRREVVGSGGGAKDGKELGGDIESRSSDRPRVLSRSGRVAVENNNNTTAQTRCNPKCHLAVGSFHSAAIVSSSSSFSSHRVFAWEYNSKHQCLESSYYFLLPTMVLCVRDAGSVVGDVACRPTNLILWCAPREDKERL